MTTKSRNILTDEVKMILEVMKEGVSITDTEDKFLYVNKSCQEMFGVSYEEVVGKNGKELEEKRIFYPEISSKVIEKKEKITEVQYNRFGDEYLVTAIPIFDENKKLINIIAYSSWDLVSAAELEEKYKELNIYNNRMHQEVLALRNNKKYDISYIIAENINIKNALNIINKMSNTDIPIFISGGSGTGKGFMANLLHSKSKRKDKPFVDLDLKLLAEDSIEKELFGSISNIGVLELSNKGTLLIKHIELLPVKVQDKLYQAITNGYYLDYKMRKILIDIRIVTCSEYSAKELLNKEKLISSLYYMLCIVTIDLPPLQERQEDLYEYILYFMKKYNKKYHKNISLNSRAMDELLNYDWSQNIHEVSQVIEQLIIHAEKNEIFIYDLPRQITKESNDYFESQMDLKQMLEFYESKIINRSYEKYKTTVGVARNLNISQATATRKLQKYIKNYNRQEE